MPGLLILFSTLSAMTAAGADTPDPDASANRTGEALYNYYCYQCHGYSGDGRTVTSRYVNPPPRDFTRSGPDSLDRELMLDAVTNGRPGTAMVSFSRVLNRQEISAVVDYIRTTFMQAPPPGVRYHTAENGWPDHERYASAFPFATGEVSLDTPAASLDDGLKQGRRLFVAVCITCHDTAAGRPARSAWELRAASYPRRHYSHRRPDAVSGASVHRRHETAPQLEAPTAEVVRGEGLYQENCAFCHAGDGTGRNWIGSFLDPRPRDFTRPGWLAGLSTEYLELRIAGGIPGTSMPAWDAVLDPDQIAAIVAYLREAFGRGAESDTAPSAVTSSTGGAQPDKIDLKWDRVVE